MTDPNIPAVGPSIGEMPWWRCKLSALRRRLLWWRRRWIPYLVWYGDELDVRVVLSQDKLPAIEFAGDAPPEEAFRPLFSGSFAEIEERFLEVGISFDKGIGLHGRDWEWDWSLKGPISVQFRARATKPGLRKERSRPKLVVNNGVPARLDTKE